MATRSTPRRCLPPRDDPLLERQHVFAVQLEESHSVRPAQSIRSSVEPGSQHHYLPATCLARIGQEVVEESGPQGHVVTHRRPEVDACLIGTLRPGLCTDREEEEEVLGERVVEQAVRAAALDGPRYSHSQGGPTDARRHALTPFNVHAESMAHEPPRPLNQRAEKVAVAAVEPSPKVRMDDSTRDVVRPPKSVPEGVEVAGGGAPEAAGRGRGLTGRRPPSGARRFLLGA